MIFLGGVVVVLQLALLVIVLRRDSVDLSPLSNRLDGLEKLTEKLAERSDRTLREEAARGRSEFSERLDRYTSILDQRLDAMRATVDDRLCKILFLPTEGLYAEVVRHADLCESVQRESRVLIAGPTNLAALLNSLQMGFRTLAVQKRSSEVWQLLGAVKTEFGKFGDVLDGVRKKLEQASRTMEDAGKRSRAIERKLRNVEELPTAGARLVLEPGEEGYVELDDVAAG